MEIISCLLIFNGLNSLFPLSLGIASLWFTGDLKTEPGWGEIWLPKGIKWCLSTGYSLASVCLSVTSSPGHPIHLFHRIPSALPHGHSILIIARAAQQEQPNSACPSTSSKNSTKQVLIYIQTSEIKKIKRINLYVNM